MELTDQDHEAIATKVVTKLEASHCVSFSPEERETVHTIHRARVEAKDIGHTELVAMFQFAKSLGAGFKKMIYGLGTVVLVAMIWFLIKPIIVGYFVK